MKLLLCFFVFASLCFAEVGKVVGVHDGDTLTILTDKKEEFKVRLWGIDAPELGQSFGKNAKAGLSSLAFGKRVKFDPEKTDRYGRVVSKVTLPNSQDAGSEMIRQGLAWWYVAYAKKEKPYMELEEKARSARVGLWSEKAPVAPWTWRKNESAAD